MTFECNADFGDNDAALETSFVDPMNGIRFVESQLEIQRKFVDNYKGDEHFSCYCIAWNSRGETKSNSAPVSIACEYFFHLF